MHERLAARSPRRKKRTTRRRTTRRRRKRRTTTRRRTRTRRTRWRKDQQDCSCRPRRLGRGLGKEGRRKEAARCAVCSRRTSEERADEPEEERGKRRGGVSEEIRPGRHRGESLIVDENAFVRAAGLDTTSGGPWRRRSPPKKILRLRHERRQKRCEEIQRPQ